jgi:hypothetical protein
VLHQTGAARGYRRDGALSRVGRIVVVTESVFTRAV